MTLYGDRLGVFVRNDPHWTLEEELQGAQHPTQFGQILRDLGVGYIAAHSPEAKGRIERLWDTLQDRLVAELRLHGLTTVAAAQAFLPTLSRGSQSPAGAAPGRPHRRVAAGAARSGRSPGLPVHAGRRPGQHRPPGRPPGPDSPRAPRPVVSPGWRVELREMSRWSAPGRGGTDDGLGTAPGAGRASSCSSPRRAARPPATRPPRATQGRAVLAPRGLDRTRPTTASARARLIRGGRTFSRRQRARPRHDTLTTLRGGRPHGAVTMDVFTRQRQAEWASRPSR